MNYHLSYTEKGSCSITEADEHLGLPSIRGILLLYELIGPREKVERSGILDAFEFTSAEHRHKQHPLVDR
jgi:hypothetical protein